MTHHIPSTRLYLVIFAALLVLTAITVAAGLTDLGGGRLHYVNALVALSIATAKAVLVILYFMHVRWSGQLTWIFVGAGAFWLLILMVLTLSDIFTRAWFPAPPFPIIPS